MIKSISTYLRHSHFYWLLETVLRTNLICISKLRENFKLKSRLIISAWHISKFLKIDVVGRPLLQWDRKKAFALRCWLSCSWNLSFSYVSDWNKKEKKHEKSQSAIPDATSKECWIFPRSSCHDTGPGDLHETAKWAKLIWNQPLNSIQFSRLLGWILRKINLICLFIDLSGKFVGPTSKRSPVTWGLGGLGLLDQSGRQIIRSSIWSLFGHRFRFGHLQLLDDLRQPNSVPWKRKMQNGQN